MTSEKAQEIVDGCMYAGGGGSALHQLAYLASYM